MIPSLTVRFFFLVIGPTICWFRSSLNVLEVGGIVDGLFDLPEGGRHLGHACHIEHVQGCVVENITVSKSVRDPAWSFILIVFLKLKFFSAHLTNSTVPIMLLIFSYSTTGNHLEDSLKEKSSCMFTWCYPSEEYGTVPVRYGTFLENDVRPKKIYFSF